jgi:hypothetical protein
VGEFSLSWSYLKLEVEVLKRQCIGAQRKDLNRLADLFNSRTEFFQLEALQLAGMILRFKIGKFLTRQLQRAPR